MRSRVCRRIGLRRRANQRLAFWRCALALVLVVTVAVAAVGDAAARDHRAARGAHSIHTYSTPGTLPLRTSLFDPVSLSGPGQAAGYAIVRSVGATYVRIIASWSSIAPLHPGPNFVAADPASPGYAWTSLDATIEAAETAGLTPILDVGSSPAWALESSSAGLKAVTPNPAALGQFATAVATHYDGGHGAPPVHVFQVWNEPNVSLYLAPVNPADYRNMVNAFTASVHAVDPANIVVAGDLDPFGHPRKKMTWYSMAPLAFMRGLLCISKGPHPHATCHTPVQFDVWSHHPYTFDGPFGHGPHPDDVSLADLPKMRALLKAAVRLHRIVSTHQIQFWVTEFSWDTNPPRPHAAPLSLQARWTAESLYEMWRSGVSLVTWFLLEDEPSPSRYQSGLYFHASSLQDARPKPTRTAFRFPFVAYLQKGIVSVWGRDATSTNAVVTIERRLGDRGSWRRVARIRANKHGIFLAKLRLKATPRFWLRATAAGSGNSLAFSLKRPSTKHRFGPWGN